MAAELSSENVEAAVALFSVLDSTAAGALTHDQLRASLVGVCDITEDHMVAALTGIESDCSAEQFPSLLSAVQAAVGSSDSLSLAVFATAITEAIQGRVDAAPTPPPAEAPAPAPALQSACTAGHAEEIEELKAALRAARERTEAAEAAAAALPKAVDSSAVRELEDAVRRANNRVSELQTENTKLLNSAHGSGETAAQRAVAAGQEKIAQLNALFASCERKRRAEREKTVALEAEVQILKSKLYVCPRCRTPVQPPTATTSVRDVSHWVCGTGTGGDADERRGRSGGAVGLSESSQGRGMDSKENEKGRNLKSVLHRCTVCGLASLLVALDIPSVSLCDLGMSASSVLAAPAPAAVVCPVTAAPSPSSASCSCKKDPFGSGRVVAAPRSLLSPQKTPELLRSPFHTGAGPRSSPPSSLSLSDTLQGASGNSKSWVTSEESRILSARLREFLVKKHRSAERRTVVAETMRDLNALGHHQNGFWTEGAGDRVRAWFSDHLVEVERSSVGLSE